MEEETKEVEVVEEEQVEDTQVTEEEKFTKEEVDKLIQSSTDKRVSEALNTAKGKWEQEYQQKLEAEKSQAEKLAKMSESERMQLEFDKEKQTFEEERKQFLREKLELQTVKELSSLGLPTDFSGYVMADTADEIKENIHVFQSQWQSAIAKAVDEKLQGKTPNIANKSNSITVTKEEFDKMTYQEKMEIYSADRDAYNKLKN